MQPRMTSLLCALWLATAIFHQPARAEDDPAANIRSVMSGQFDRPDSRLNVGPVVVVADHAIAGWTQGDMEAGRCCEAKATNGKSSCAAVINSSLPTRSSRSGFRRPLRKPWPDNWRTRRPKSI